MKQKLNALINIYHFNTNTEIEVMKSLIPRVWCWPMAKLHANCQQGLVLTYGKITCKLPTRTARFGLADDIWHQPRHQLQEVRHNFRGQPQHQRDFNCGVEAGVGVVGTPTPASNTTIEVTQCPGGNCHMPGSNYHMHNIICTTLYKYFVSSLRNIQYISRIYLF